MTTREAFNQVISERGGWQKYGIKESTWRSYRKYFNDKSSKLSVTKMEEVLELAGYKVVQEKLWEGGE